jgi:hypothetical protein
MAFHLKISLFIGQQEPIRTKKNYLGPKKITKIHACSCMIPTFMITFARFHHCCSLMKIDISKVILFVMLVLSQGIRLSAQESVGKSNVLQQPVKANEEQNGELKDADVIVGGKTASELGLSPSLQGLEMPTMSYRLDSLRMRQIVFGHYNDGSSKSFAIDFHDEGVLSSWRDGYLYGNSGHQTMIGLMMMQHARMGMIQQFGNFTAGVGISASRYAFPYALRGGNVASGMPNLYAPHTQLGINGSLTYSFNENLSMTVFGNYVSHSFYYSMAAFPYIGTSSYGGYFTLKNDNVGIDLGTERQYDPFSRQWRTVPIVTPQFKMGKVKVELPVGELVGHALENVFHKGSSRQGPIIMPQPIR